MHNSIKDIQKYFKKALKNGEFTTDRKGGKTIELIGANFIADKPSIFGKPNEDYIEAEIYWYESGSTNINTLANIYGKSPTAWQHSANKHGEINSNYGHLIYSSKYHDQYTHVLHELFHNPDSRRACMVYNRPSIWEEYNEDGKNDFICTNAVTYYIRDNKLHAVVQMRSNDVVFGYKNDYAWQRYVMEQIIIDYNRSPQNLFESVLEMGDLYWSVQNLHVYARHFDLVK